MEAALKKKWLDGLTSGAYVQGRGALRSKNDEFCCLGVLYDVAGGQWIDLDKAWWHTNDRRGGCLSDRQEEILGIDTDATSALVNMNDFHKNTFPEITAWIEANV